MGDKEALNLGLSGFAPAVQQPLLRNQSPRAHAVQEGRQRRDQRSALERDSRPQKKSDAHKRNDEDEVSNNDCFDSSAQGCFQAGDQRLHEISEPDRKEKEGEGFLYLIQEGYCQGKDQRGRENPCGLWIPQFCQHDSLLALLLADPDLWVTLTVYACSGHRGF